MKFLVTLLGLVSILCSHTAFAQQTIDTVVIIDTSGSMNDQYSTGAAQNRRKIDVLKERLPMLLNKMVGKQEQRLSVITFRDVPILNRSFSPIVSETEISDLVNSLSVSGETPLSQSILMAADLLATSTAQNKNLLILADGQNNDGLDALRNSISTFNSKASARVQMIVFENTVNSQVWAYFKGLSQILVEGTLFLFDGDTDNAMGGEIINLTYDLLTRDKAPSQVRQNFREYLKSTGKADVHARHVHISSPGVSVKSDPKSKQPLKQIDWEVLKREDPNQYNELKSLLESIESDFMISQAKVASFKMLVYAMNGFAPTFVDLASLDGGTQPPHQKPLGIGQRFENLAYYASIGSGTPNASSYKSADAYLSMTGENRRAESADAVAVRALLSFGTSAILTGATFSIKPGFMQDRLATSGMSSIFSGMAQILSAGSADGSRDTRQEHEQRIRSQYFETQKAVRLLTAIHPHLSSQQLHGRAEILANVHSSPKQKLQALIGDSPEDIKTADRFLGALDRLARASSQFKGNPRERIAGLRSSDILPTEIEAYLNSLWTNMDSIDDSYSGYFNRGYGLSSRVSENQIAVLKHVDEESSKLIVRLRKNIEAFLALL